MRGIKYFLCSAVLAGVVFAAGAQPRPYIGYSYPAGGQQGTAVSVKLGGQGLETPLEVLISGSGVSGKIVEYNRALNPQEIALLREQLKELNKADRKEGAQDMMSGDTMQRGAMSASNSDSKADNDISGGSAQQTLIAKLQRRLQNNVNRPASAALAHIVYIEVNVSVDAEPGRRELRLRTFRGISNPVYFYVGQLREYSREPMITAPLQILGKEELALRKRPVNQVEDRIKLPATLNGQIASGEINRYRFEAAKGQKLVVNTLARQLVPFIADAVPGWFQPVLVLKDAAGKEVAYDDDYQFRPDPVILFEVPSDGEYALEIYDAIYRGREDFVYRISIGELPFVTSMFPLGARKDTPVTVKLEGWNLEEGVPIPVIEQDRSELCRVFTKKSGLVSNRRPFVLDDIPEALEQEPNNTVSRSQKVRLPVVLNGRIDEPGDWDVFRFWGKSNQVVVAEVSARRLESPLDSVLKLTDAAGQLVAFDDDYENPFGGINTHDADSYIRATLPADGAYCVHLGDTAEKGGKEFAYRLRLSSPEPDFALRVMPSSISMRSKNSTAVTVRLVRKDGLSGPVKVALKNPPEGFFARPITLAGTNTTARLNIKTELVATEEPVDLVVEGSARIGGREVTRVAVPAEDRMQAFLWRHLVPADNLKVLVYSPSDEPPPKRTPPELPPADAAAANGSSVEKPKFTKQQVASRLRQLRLLYEEGLFTDEFYLKKVAECEAARNG